MYDTLRSRMQVHKEMRHSTIQNWGPFMCNAEVARAKVMKLEALLIMSFVREDRATISHIEEAETRRIKWSRLGGKR